MILNQRLKWYRGEMAIALNRHRHVLALLFLLLIPAGVEWQAIIELTHIISIPVRSIAYPESSIVLVIKYYMLLVVISIAWMNLQKSAVKGEPFASFVRSLPLPPETAWRVDAYLVLIADGVLWLLFITAFITAPYSEFSFSITAVFFLRVGALAVTLVCIQAAYIYLERGIFLIPLLVYTSLVVFGGLVRWADSVTYSLFTLIIVCTLLVKMKMIGGLLLAKWPPIAADGATVHLVMRIHPLFSIYFRLLFIEHGLAVFARLALVLIVAAMLGVAVSHNSDHSGEHAMDMFTLYMAFSAYMASGLFDYLCQERNSILPLLQTLPTRALYWIYIDYAYVYVGLLVAVAPLAGYLGYSGYLTSSELIFLLMYVILLLGVLYPIRIKMKKQASVTALVSCVLWSLTCIIFT